MFVEPDSLKIFQNSIKSIENQNVDIKIDTSDIKTTKIFGDVLTFKLKG